MSAVHAAPTATQFWARFYKEPDPTKPNNPRLDGVEVPWEPDAINELMKEAFPGPWDWYVRPNSLNLAIALGRNLHGTYELVVEERKTGQRGHVWATISPWPTVVPKPNPKQHPAYADKVTGALMKDALKTHGKDACPKCKSKSLHFYRTVLRCDRCLTHVGGC